ncbi:unnamed protein product, partial [Cuscuta campestris]
MCATPQPKRSVKSFRVKSTRKETSELNGRGSAAWLGSGSRGVVRPLEEGLVADCPNLRGLRERANGGGYLEPFKDVHHQKRVREEVIVVGGRGDRHVDHDKLCPIDWGRMYDRMDELEVFPVHDGVAVLLRFEDPGDDVEDEAAFGVGGVDGWASRGMAFELSDAKLVEDKALGVEHLILSTIVRHIVALEGEAGDAPKLLHGELDRRALDKRVEHVVLTPEVGVEGSDQRRVDLLSCPGDERPKAGLMKLRVEVIVALQLRVALRDDPWGSHNPFREKGEKSGALLLGIEPEVRPIAVVEAFLGGCGRCPGFRLRFPGGSSPTLVFAHGDEEISKKMLERIKYARRLKKIEFR